MNQHGTLLNLETLKLQRRGKRSYFVDTSKGTNICRKTNNYMCFCIVIHKFFLDQTLHIIPT